MTQAPGRLAGMKGESVIEFLQGTIPSWGIDAARVGTHFGDYWFLITVTIAVSILARDRPVRPAVIVCGAHWTHDIAQGHSGRTAPRAPRVNRARRVEELAEFVPFSDEWCRLRWKDYDEHGEYQDIVRKVEDTIK